MKIKNTAHLAVTAGLCASLLMGGVPLQVYADDAAGVEPAETEAVGVEADEAALNMDDPAGDEMQDDVPASASSAISENAPTSYVVDENGNVTIGDFEAFKYFRDQVNGGNAFQGKTITLGADIDLANEEWTAIGNSSNAFKGVFDGAGNTVSNLKITKGMQNTKANSYQGLFGHLQDSAAVKNVTVNNVDITGSLYVGAIAGMGYTGKEISNCNVTGLIQIDAYWYAGAIGGYGYMSKVSGCSVKGDPGSYIKSENGSYVGGVWGFRGEGNMATESCSVEGIAISAVDRVGGITGQAHYGNSIKGCTVSKVEIKATDPAATTIGSIAGACQGTVTNPTTFENNTVEQTVSASAGDRVVTGEHGTNIGGYRPVVNNEFVAHVGGTDYTSVSEAIKHAKTGDTVKLAEGRFEPFTVPAGVILEGAGAGKTVITNSKDSHFLLSGDNTTLKNLTIDSSADGYYLAGPATTTPTDNLTLDGVEFIGNGKAGSTAIWIHEPNITIKNCTFKDYERGYYTCGDNHAIGQMVFTGNTFTNVKVPLDGYWGKPAENGKITIKENVFDGGTWGKAFVQLWDYAQYQYWLDGSGSKLNPDGKTAIKADVTGNKGDFDLILTHGNWYSMSELNTDHKVVKRSLVVIGGDDVESVTVKNADGTPVTNWNEHPNSMVKGDKTVIYTMSEGDYIFEVTHKAKDGADAIVTTQEVKLVAPKVGEEAPTVEVAPLPNDLSVATVVKADGTKTTYDSLEKAIAAAEKGETIELNSSIKVADWNQIWPDGTASKLDGITIDGKGNALTIEKLSSNGNGNYLIYNAKNLSVKNITINLPETAKGFDMESGELTNVKINGGVMGAYLGNGDITVDGCSFSGVDSALYTEANAGKLVVKDSTFAGCDYVAILKKTDSTFVNNTVSGGKLNIMAPEQKVQGNTFANGSRIKFYAESVDGAFSKNDISTDSQVALGDSVKEPVLNGNYWGSPEGPVAGQLPEGTKLDTWYEDEDMGRLNTDPDIFKVTFVFGNGQQDMVVDVEDGKTVSKPDDPKREGYTFAGWYADAEGKTEFDFSAVITADTKAYAKWAKDETPVPIVHKVTFVPVVGGDEVIVVEVADGKYVKLPQTPKVEGYTFAGWFFDKDLKKPFDAEKDAIVGDLTLYGGWYKNGVEEPVSPQKPEAKPGSALPQTGDVSMLPILAAGGAGVAAVAAGALISKRRKAE